MQTFDGQRSDEPPGRRSFEAFMAECRPFHSVAVPGDEKVPSEFLIRQAREYNAARETEGGWVPYQDLLFGVGMGIC